MLACNRPHRFERAQNLTSHGAVDGALSGNGNAKEHGIEISQGSQIYFRKIFAVREAVEWRIDIGARIGNHFDFADLEGGSFGIVLFRSFAAEKIADEWSRKALICNHAFFKCVTQIDERHKLRLAP